MHPVFHVSKLRWYKSNDFNQPVPQVTLNVHGENWAPAEILNSCLAKERVEYFVQWKDQATLHDTWELEDRMKMEAPEMTREFHRRNPDAARGRRRSVAHSEISP